MIEKKILDHFKNSILLFVFNFARPRVFISFFRAFSLESKKIKGFARCSGIENDKVCVGPPKKEVLSFLLGAQLMLKGAGVFRSREALAMCPPK